MTVVLKARGTPRDPSVVVINGCRGRSTNENHQSCSNYLYGVVGNAGIG